MTTATEKVVAAAKPKPRAPRQAKVNPNSPRPAIGPRMKGGEFEAAPKKPAAPAPSQPATTTPVPGKDSPSAGFVKRAGGSVNVARRLGGGLLQNGHPSGTGPIVPIMAVVFIIVAVAKVRGAAQINTKRAVFGGFLATFLLMALYKLNAQLGTAFAALVLVQVLLEYGLVALQGLTQGGAYSSTPLGSNKTLYTSYGTAYSDSGLAPLSPNARPGMNIETGAPILISTPDGQVQVPAGTNINAWLSSHGYPTSSIFN